MEPGWHPKVRAGDFASHAFSPVYEHVVKTLSARKIGFSSFIPQSFYELQASVNAATCLPDETPDADQKPSQYAESICCLSGGIPPEP